MRLPASAWVLAGSLVLFGMLAAISVTGVTVHEETEALRDLHAGSPSVLESAMRAVSTVGGGWGVTVVATAVAIGLLVRRRIGAAALFSAMMIGASLNGPLKAIFDRPRPDLWAQPTPFSGLAFPSGHAMSSATLVVALVALTWSWRWRLPVLIAGSLVAVVVGLSRLVLGAHYPSDVLGGWAFALAWVSGVYLVARQLRRSHALSLDQRSQDEPGEAGGRPGSPRALGQRRNDRSFEAGEPHKRRLRHQLPGWISCVR